MNDKEFETLLRNRHVEPPRTGFAERIIAAARYTQPKPATGISAWLQAFMADLLLPRPAFALASVLIIGFAIGLSTPAPQTGGEEEISLQTYLENDGATL